MDEDLQQAAAQQPEQEGRGTDTVMAHMTPGEIVIPIDFQQDPQVMEMLQALFQHNGVDLAEFTVGTPANKINPETGYPEFGLFKSIKKIFKTVAPAALAYFGAPAVLGSTTLGGALAGAGIGAATGGGLKGAALGGLTGGIGANLDDIGGALGIGNASDGFGSSVVRGNAGDLLSGAASPTSNISGIGGLIGGTGSGGGSSTFNLGSAVAKGIGAYSDDEALKKAQKDLLAGNSQQLSNLSSFDPSGITSDPGYQFQLDQGLSAQNKALGAQGNLFSGRALQAAQDYGQKSANTAFNDYYKRWLAQTQGQNDLYGSNANINASTGLARSSNLGSSLTGVFGG